MSRRKKAAPKAWSAEVRADVAKRHAAGESARAIAKATGVPASTVVRWTRGDRAPSSPAPQEAAAVPAAVPEPAASPAPAPAAPAAPPPPPAVAVPDLPAAPPVWEFQAAPVAGGEPPKPADAVPGAVPPPVEMPAPVAGMPDLTAEQSVAMSRQAVVGMVKLVDSRLKKAGADPLEPDEKAALEDAWTPVAHKYLAGKITPEMNALVITVVVIGPRLMSVRERKKAEADPAPRDAVAAQTQAQAAATAEVAGVDTAALMARLGAPSA